MIVISIWLSSTAATEDMPTVPDLNADAVVPSMPRGSIDNERIRESVNLTSWDAAQGTVRGWKVPELQAKTEITLYDALSKFVAAQPGARRSRFPDRHSRFDLPTAADEGECRYDRGEMTVRITEAELARDVGKVLEKVEQGSEVIIEQDDHRPVAVIHALHRSGRPITEILREAKHRNSTTILDEDFGSELEDIIATHQHPWQPPSWD